MLYDLLGASVWTKTADYTEAPGEGGISTAESCSNRVKIARGGASSGAPDTIPLNLRDHRRFSVVQPALPRVRPQVGDGPLVDAASTVLYDLRGASGWAKPPIIRKQQGRAEFRGRIVLKSRRNRPWRGAAWGTGHHPPQSSPPSRFSVA